jgi:hypothetical protein
MAPCGPSGHSLSDTGMRPRHLIEGHRPGEAMRGGVNRHHLAFCAPELPQGRYGSASAPCCRVALIAIPSAVAPAMITIATKNTRRAYSVAVAPSSLRRSRAMKYSSVCFVMPIPFCGPGAAEPLLGTIQHNLVAHATNASHGTLEGRLSSRPGRTPVLSRDDAAVFVSDGCALRASHLACPSE